MDSSGRLDHRRRDNPFTSSRANHSTTRASHTGATTDDPKRAAKD
ncbi:unnamed protein product [Heligmosomoides polygyrus]|uniref:Uncharacterized protein n=1 Tax=Heligmosomoides polygyrus TaxID=6339 RepID=A0A3P8IYC7_HELPZ|nr:unnamed protein product [Heligmosomoides polygyrus]